MADIYFFCLLIHECGPKVGGVFYFLYTLGKLAKRGGGWLPSGATRGCYPQGLLELSEILAQEKIRLGEVAKEACILIRCRDDLPP